MLPVTALQSIRVMVATPCYASGVMAQYCTSMVSLAAECVKAGLYLRFELHAESLLTRGRNNLVALFLSDPSLTHFFFIDADIGFSAQNFARLLLSEKDVACGVYPLKRYDWPTAGLPQNMTEQQFKAVATHYPINPLPTSTLEVDKDGFAEVAEATTGFMCIKREVFDRLMKAYPELHYVPEKSAGHSPEVAGSHWLFFDTMHDKAAKRYISEDYAFCRRWRDIGGQVFIDTNSKLDHQGQHTWRGDLKAHLNALRR